MLVILLKFVVVEENNLLSLPDHLRTSLTMTRETHNEFVLQVAMLIDKQQPQSVWQLERDQSNAN